MDSVQKHNICTNVPASQTFRSHYISAPDLITMMLECCYSMNEVMHDGDIQHLAGHHRMIGRGSPVFTMQNCNITMNNNILLIINNAVLYRNKHQHAQIILKVVVRWSEIGHPY
jgi:hypothetical protein